MPWSINPRNRAQSAPVDQRQSGTNAQPSQTDEPPSSPQKASSSTLRQPTLATQPLLEASAPIAPIQPAMLRSQQRTDSDRSSRSRRRLTASFGSFFGRERRDSNKSKPVDGRNSSAGSSDSGGTDSTQTGPQSSLPTDPDAIVNEAGQTWSQRSSPVTAARSRMSSSASLSRQEDSPPPGPSSVRRGSLLGSSRSGSNVATSLSSPDDTALRDIAPWSMSRADSSQAHSRRLSVSNQGLPTRPAADPTNGPSRESLGSEPSSMSRSSEGVQRLGSDNDTPPSSLDSPQIGTSSVPVRSFSPVPNLQLSSALHERRQARYASSLIDAHRPASINSIASHSLESHDHDASSNVVTVAGIASSDDSHQTSRPPSTVAARLRTLPRLESYRIDTSVPRERSDSTEDSSRDEDDEFVEDDEDDEEDPDEHGSGEDDSDVDTYESANEADHESQARAAAPVPLATLSRGSSSNASSGDVFARPGTARSSSSRLRTATSNGASGGWVQFSSVTPTPGTMHTARASTAADTPNNHSYFDLPQHLTTAGGEGSHSAGSGRLPGTPFIPQSLSSVARGRRPVQQTPAGSRTPSAGGLLGSAGADDSERAQAVQSLEQYRMRSQSVFALNRPVMFDEEEAGPTNQAQTSKTATELDPVWQKPGISTPGPSWLSSQASYIRTPAGEAPAAVEEQTRSSAGKSPGATGRTQRRRSMYELHDAPPLYVAEYRRGTEVQRVFPREEEGKEKLPSYTCAVHIEGYMPRKMEFSAPAVQSKDRAWKRQYVVVHGTSIKVYRYDLRTHPIQGEQDWSNVKAEIAGKDGPPPLHFHEGEYGSEIGPSKFPISIGDAKSKAKHTLVAHSTGAAPNGNRVIRHYSLQNAESGLAADYIKRKHVVRVRAEGEQFLLQAKDDRGVIDLIEALQAATNVALDLDQRQLPKLITLPRRRRRRRRPVDANAATGTGDQAAGTSTAGSSQPANSTTAGPTEARGAHESRLSEMLAEEQHAYSQGNGGATVM